MPGELVFGSTKTYTASVGISAAFRQWRAASHCKYLHGYALEFVATFEADELDNNRWVVDFGGLKSFKDWLVKLFDHATIVAADDPEFKLFTKMASAGICRLCIVENTGCEALALLVFQNLDDWLTNHKYSPRVRLMKLEVREHDGNSAYVRRKG